MNNKNLHKYLPYLISILVPLVICFVFFKADLSKQVEPKLEQQNKRIIALEKQNVDSLITVINKIFLLSRGNVNIKVGINATLNGGDATIFKNEILDFLEVDASFYLTNPKNALKPCIEIKIIEEKSRTNSDADLFIGLEAAEMLGIKEDMLHHGVFDFGVRKIGNGF